MSLLFPRTCPVCGEIVVPRGHLICPVCQGKLSLVRQPVCKKCGKEVIAERIEYCPDCRRRPHTFEQGMALLNYGEAERHSMAAIKYQNRREYLDFYAWALSVRYEKRVRRIAPEVLIPVPAHPSRKRQRGFNQAEELAARLGRRWGIPVCSDLLLRKRKTDPQKELSPSERLKNLQDAFAVQIPVKKFVCGRNKQGASGQIPHTVVLIDDIYTTGSTVEACTRVLKRAGVQRVYVIVICIGKGDI